MTSRLTVLDNFGATELSASVAQLKKINHDEPKFRNILADTDSKHSKDSSAADQDEKNHNIDHKENNLKPQVNELNSSNTNSKDSTESRHYQLEENEQKFNDQNLVTEKTQILDDITIIPIPAINILDNENVINDLAVEKTDSLVMLQNEKVFFGELQTEEIVDFSMNDLVTDKSVAANIKVTESNIPQNIEESVKQIPLTIEAPDNFGIKLSQILVSGHTEVASKNVLIPKDLHDNLSLEADEVIISETEKDSKELPAHNAKDIVIISPVIAHINAKSSNQTEEVDSGIMVTDRLPISQGFLQLRSDKNNLAAEIIQEECKIIVQNDDEVSAGKKEYPRFMEVQNSLKSDSFERLLPANNSDTDQSFSGKPNNLLSETNNFVTINDGKLSISFKEIVSLPEENIPHRADQISMAIKTAANKGQNEISLHMYPEDLGTVDVKIEFSEVGKIQSIKFFAAKESTLELLQKDYSILERSLKEVISADEASLSFNLKDGKDQGGGYQSMEGSPLKNIIKCSERISAPVNYQVTLHIEEDHVNIIV